MKNYILILPIIAISIQSPNILLASCWSDCDDKFDKFYQEADRIRCKAECEAKNVVEKSGYETNKFDLKNEVEGGGWTVAWSDDISETDAAQGVVAAGVSIYSSNPAVFMEWIENLIDRTVDSLYADMQKEYRQKAIDLAREVIFSAIKGKTAKEIADSMDTVDFKAGAIKYSGRNYIGDTTISRTWGLKAYVAFRIRASSANSEGQAISPSGQNQSIVSKRDGLCLYTDDYQIENKARVVPCDRGGQKGRLWKYDAANLYIISARDGGCLYTDDYIFEGNVRVVPCDRGGRKGRQWKIDSDNGFIVSERNGMCLYTDDYQFEGNVRVVPCDRGGRAGRQWKFQ